MTLRAVPREQCAYNRKNVTEISVKQRSDQQILCSAGQRHHVVQWCRNMHGGNTTECRCNAPFSALEMSSVILRACLMPGNDQLYAGQASRLARGL